MSRKYPRIHHEVDSGDVTADAVHIGDGYYHLTLKCRAHGDDATVERTVLKNMVKGMFDAWAQQHWHNP